MGSCRLLLVSIALLFVSSGSALAQSQAAGHLEFAARAWGLAKYRHPQVTRCQVDWDAALLARLPAIEAATSEAERDAALAALLAAAGSVSGMAPSASTPAWIRDTPMNSGLREQLAAIAARAPEGACYVTRSDEDAATFASDIGAAGAAPTRAQRLLAAFRFWNAVEHFFPYKADIGRDWGGVLREHVLGIANAAPGEAYELAVRRFTAEIHDTHAYMSSPSGQASREASPPFWLRRIEGRVVLDRRLPEAGTAAVGDELMTVNGRAFDELYQERLLWAYGSNPAAKQDLTLQQAAAGAGNGSASFGFKRADGSSYTLSLPRHFDFYARLDQGSGGAWRTETLAQCRIGVINMGRLQPEQVDAALAALSNTDGIVFDLRAYPNGTAYELLERVLPEERLLVRYDRPDMQNPGAFVREDLRFGGGRYNGYTGRFLLLLDERSISQSEFTAMTLQARGNALVFGSQTAAADGNLTSVPMPGNVSVSFSGLGIYYPNGERTQRVGIVPDLHVYPSLAGLRSGQDEVLNSALDCRWISAAPEPRMPEPGFYWDPARAGEGLEVHRLPGARAFVQYAYDAEGQPEWLLGVASVYAGGEWTAPMDRFRPNMVASPAGDMHMNRHRGAYEPICAIADQGKIAERASLRSAIDGGHSDQCVQPIFSSGNSPMTGLWAGPGDDGGWGIGIHRDGEALAVILYAFDAEGKPRWALGTGQINTQGEAEIQMLRYSGFCRSCPPQPTPSVAAGQMRLRLGTNGTGTVDIDVAMSASYRWQRTALPISRLTSEQ